ncbi:O-antigen ligase family protein [Priestia aryabhattai]|uniref:O-antigen ligase family protein n=1 Tax=Priestia TaxID=2800373 RepID=UPI00336B55F4
MRYSYAIILTILTGCIVPFLLMGDNRILLFTIPVSIGIIAWIQFKKKVIKPEHFLFFLLASTAIPHSILPGGLKVSISDLYLIFAFILLIIINQYKFNVPNTYFIIAIIYVTLATLSLIWADNSSKGITRLFQYFEFMIITVFVFYNIKHVHYKKMLNGYVFISTILSLVAISFYIIQGGSGPVYMLGYHKNALGAVLGTSIPIILGLYFLSKEESTKNHLVKEKRKRFRFNLSTEQKVSSKKIYLICFTINIIGLISTLSRGALLGSIASILVLLFFIGKTKQIFIIVPLLATCISVYLYFAPSYLEQATAFDKFSSAYSRVTIFDDATKKINEHPILGEGVGNYSIEIPWINFSQDDPNNVFLLNLVEMGFIGLVAFILLILCIFIYALTNKKKHKYNNKIKILNAIFISTFTARLVHIQVDVSWVRGIGIFMFAVVGMLLALRKIDRVNKPIKSAK